MRSVDVGARTHMMMMRMTAVIVAVVVTRMKGEGGVQVWIVEAFFIGGDALLRVAGRVFSADKDYNVTTTLIHPFRNQNEDLILFYLNWSCSR